MKHLLLLLTSLALFACGGGDSSTEETAEDVVKEAGESMRDAMDDAAAVEDVLKEKADEVDEAIDDGTE